MKNLLSNFLRDEQGQDLVEYTLLLAFVALAGAAVFTSIGNNLKSIWGHVDTTVNDAATAAAPAAS